MISLFSSSPPPSILAGDLQIWFYGSGKAHFIALIFLLVSFRRLSTPHLTPLRLSSMVLADTLRVHRSIHTMVVMDTVPAAGKTVLITGPPVKYSPPDELDHKAGAKLDFFSSQPQRFLTILIVIPQAIPSTEPQATNPDLISEREDGAQYHSQLGHHWYENNLGLMGFILSDGSVIGLSSLKVLWAFMGSLIRLIKLLVGTFYGTSLFTYLDEFVFEDNALLSLKLQSMSKHTSGLPVTVSLPAEHDLRSSVLLEANTSQRKFSSTETTNIPYAMISTAHETVFQSRSQASVCNYDASLLLSLGFLTLLLGWLDFLIRLGSGFSSGILRIIVKLNSPIRPLFVSVGILFNSCSSFSWWTFDIEPDEMESQGLLVALCQLFNLRHSFVVIGLQARNTTSLTDVYICLRESPFFFVKKRESFYLVSNV